MKNWILALLVLLFGAAVGSAVAVGQLGFSARIDLPGRGASEESVARAVESARATDAGSPKIVVDQETFDFGTMDNQSEQKHDFVIRNDGTSPLKIENKGTSCKCAISDFKIRVVRPGKSTKVTLTWTAKDYYGPYSQTAQIATNDPEHPKVTLTVKGRVTALLRALPSDVVFSDISAGHDAHSTVRLYAYKSNDLEVTDVRLQDPSTAEFFKITPRRLSAEEISQEKDAQSGYELQIEVKSGLPLGRFLQTILVSTNLPKASKIEIPVRGKVGGDITIAGRDWDTNRQSLRLGVLRHGEGAERTLLLVVRGRYRRTIDFEIAEVFPPELVTAELGEPSRGGLTVRVPLKIHITKQSGPANYLGSRQSPSGHILLNTNHPQNPTINIPISFAIEGG